MLCKIFFLLCFILMAFFPTHCFAQVLDMRSLSRQRGYTGYQPKPVQTYRAVAPKPKKEPEPEQTKEEEKKEEQKKVKASDKEKEIQSEETRSYIYDNPHVQPDL